jgi:3-hydroxyacyl-[acyl-carrier-protein] dehydratase
MRLEYFQLIDRVTALSLSERTIAVDAAVPAQSTIFEGHFPGLPLMPGVLLVEAMAQSSGWLIIALTRFERMPFLAQIKEAKLRNFVPPSTLLNITATLLHEGSGYAVTKAKIAANGKPVCDAELTFRAVPFPTPDFRQVMRDWAARISFPMEQLADA